MPSQGKPPYPGILALHDHGEFFYFGKEKIVSSPQEHSFLKKWREQYYGSRAYAEELARRGYVVLVIDAFYFSERRLQFEKTPSDMAKKLSGLSPSSEEYVSIWNDLYVERKNSVNTMMGYCGTTWLGIIVHDDRKSIDLLQSIPEVDPQRIGALGLSGGGYRNGYLVGMDERIKAAVIVGWMTELADLVKINEPVHAGLMIAEGVYRHLDYPDIVSLAAPECALNVFNCGQDQLFTFSGMKQASEKIQRVYKELKASNRYAYKFFDVPHQFNVEMQEEAFEWLDRWLKSS
jgi:dienelactone hydrolase